MRPSRRGLGRLVAALAFAALATAATAAAALACEPETEGRLPISEIEQAAAVIVEGTVTSSDVGPDTVVRFDVLHGRVIKGAAKGSHAAFSGGNCPFNPEIGARVVVATWADGEVIEAWTLDSKGQAAGWIPTDPDLSTSREVRAALRAPETAAPPPLASPGSQGPGGLEAAALLALLGIVAFIVVLRWPRWSHRRA
jgi:hypothetical protein